MKTRNLTTPELFSLQTYINNSLSEKVFFYISGVKMFIKEIKIKSYDVDKNNNAKISSIMKYFQQIARENLDQFGMTYDFLREHNIVFVLAKYKFKFYRNLHCDEKFIFKTSPCGLQGVSFIRDFVVEDADGNRCCEASSSWVIIDFVKRSILRPNRLPLPITSDPDLVDFVPDRLSTNVRYGESRNYATKVTYSQLDANNHLNNCCYADIMLDGLFDIYNNIPEIKELDMSFDHEAAVCSELLLEYYQKDEKIHIYCNNTTAELPCFSAVITL